MRSSSRAPCPDRPAEAERSGQEICFRSPRYRPWKQIPCRAQERTTPHLVRSVPANSACRGDGRQSPRRPDQTSEGLGLEGRRGGGGGEGGRRSPGANEPRVGRTARDRTGARTSPPPRRAESGLYESCPRADADGGRLSLHLVFALRRRCPAIGSPSPRPIRAASAGTWVSARCGCGIGIMTKCGRTTSVKRAPLVFGCPRRLRRTGSSSRRRVERRGEYQKSLSGASGAQSGSEATGP